MFSVLLIIFSSVLMVFIVNPHIRDIYGKTCTIIVTMLIELKVSYFGNFSQQNICDSRGLQTSSHLCTLLSNPYTHLKF